MIGGCLAGLLVGWLMGWRGSAAACRGVLLDFAWKVRVDAMEYEMIEAKVPKGFVRDGWQLVIGEKAEGDCLVKSLGPTLYGEEVWLLLRPVEKKELEKDLRKPSDWKPCPSLAKWTWGSGWITWDERGEWMWWSMKPMHWRDEGWLDTHRRQRSGSSISRDVGKSMGFPDCAGFGFNERECIWHIDVK